MHDHNHDEWTCCSCEHSIDRSALPDPVAIGDSMLMYGANPYSINYAVVFNGDLKTAGLPLDKMTEKSKAYLQGMVDDMEKIFVSYVTKHRKVTPETLALIKDGRAVIGKDAKELSLVDELGGIHEARNWLEEAHSISKSTPVFYKELEHKKPLLEEILGEAHILSKKIVSSLFVYGI